jgi:peptidoglycan/LPS O-acetylase OafA/YrhL
MLHCSLVSPLAGTRNIPFIDRGYLAVDFFFILSGFVLASAYGHLAVKSLTAYRTFLWRRFARLFPLHWGVLLLMYLAARDAGSSPGWPYALMEFSLMNEWGLVPTKFSNVMNPVDWSLSTEWFVNIIFPLLAWVFMRGSIWRVPILCTSILGCLVLILILNHNTVTCGDPFSLLPLLRCATDFSAGLMIFRFRAMLIFCAGPYVFGATLIIFAIALLLPGTDLLVVACACIFIAGLAQNTGFVARALSHWSFHRLGQISYSIYLIQIPIMGVMLKLSAVGSPIESGILFFVASVVGTLAVATLTYYGLERPAQAFLRFGGFPSTGQIASANTTASELATKQLDRRFDIKI